MKKILIPLVFVVYFLHVVSCDDNSKNTIKKSKEEVSIKKMNPVVYFELPVKDMNRAIKFYKAVFNFDFEKDTVENNEMALFPFDAKNMGISGALAKGEIYKPTNDGVLIYFNTENIDETFMKAISSGGKKLYPKTDNGIGFVAEFEDTEGNRIALYQKK